MVRLAQAQAHDRHGSVVLLIADPADLGGRNCDRDAEHYLCCLSSGRRPDQRACGRRMDLDRRPCHDTGRLATLRIGDFGGISLARVRRGTPAPVVSSAGCDRCFPAPRCVNRPRQPLSARTVAVDRCRASKRFRSPRGFIALSEKRKQTRPLISVVMPVYNEAANVSAMHEALSATLSGCPSFDWEFVFVDDGSTDNTFELLEQANSIDPRVKVIRLSRNYGSHIGAAAGLRFASGDATLIMAADLQDHPREIPRLVERWREGFDVVWAIRSQRSDGKLGIFLSHVFAAMI